MGGAAATVIGEGLAAGWVGGGFAGGVTALGVSFSPHPMRTRDKAHAPTQCVNFIPTSIRWLYPT